jgi:hypothetical protein
MPRIKLGGQVFGLNTQPITHATIKIIDTDFGSSNDVILRTRTDGEGKFTGRSSNWKDANWINVGFGARIPTPDILSLEFEVKKGNETHRGLFIHLWDYHSAPIVCPWSNPDTLFAKVNNINCYGPEETKESIERLISLNQLETLEIFDTATRQAFSSLAEDKRIIRNSTGTIYGASTALAVGSTTTILLAIAAIIIASSAAIGIVFVGLSLLLAIDKGCENIEFEQGTGVNNLGENKSTLKVKFNC